MKKKPMSILRYARCAFSKAIVQVRQTRCSVGLRDSCDYGKDLSRNEGGREIDYGRVPRAE